MRAACRRQTIEDAEDHCTSAIRPSVASTVRIRRTVNIKERPHPLELDGNRCRQRHRRELLRGGQRGAECGDDRLVAGTERDLFGGEPGQMIGIPQVPRIAQCPIE